MFTLKHLKATRIVLALSLAIQAYAIWFFVLGGIIGFFDSWYRYMSWYTPGLTRFFLDLGLSSQLDSLSEIFLPSGIVVAALLELVLIAACIYAVDLHIRNLAKKSL